MQNQQAGPAPTQNEQSIAQAIDTFFNNKSLDEVIDDLGYMFGQCIVSTKDGEITREYLSSLNYSITSLSVLLVKLKEIKS